MFLFYLSDYARSNALIIKLDLVSVLSVRIRRFYFSPPKMMMTQCFRIFGYALRHRLVDGSKDFYVRLSKQEFVHVGFTSARKPHSQARRVPLRLQSALRTKSFCSVAQLPTQFVASQSTLLFVNRLCLRSSPQTFSTRSSSFFPPFVLTPKGREDLSPKGTRRLTHSAALSTSKRLHFSTSKCPVGSRSRRLRHLPDLYAYTTPNSLRSFGIAPSPGL